MTDVQQGFDEKCTKLQRKFSVHTKIQATVFASIAFAGFYYIYESNSAKEIKNTLVAEFIVLAYALLAYWAGSTNKLKSRKAAYIVYMVFYTVLEVFFIDGITDFFHNLWTTQMIRVFELIIIMIITHAAYCLVICAKLWIDVRRIQNDRQTEEEEEVKHKIGIFKQSWINNPCEEIMIV